MTVASDEHGRPVHLQIRMSRAGGVLRGLLDSLAVSVSLGLQRGVPLSDYVEQLALARFEPSGWTPALGDAHSIVDLAFHCYRAGRPRTVLLGPVAAALGEADGWLDGLGPFEALERVEAAMQCVTPEELEEALAAWEGARTHGGGRGHAMTPADMEASFRSELRRCRLREAAPSVRGLVALCLLHPVLHRIHGNPEFPGHLSGEQPLPVKLSQVPTKTGPLQLSGDRIPSSPWASSMQKEVPQGAVPETRPSSLPKRPCHLPPS